jgi:hypothetical protein
MNCHAIDPHQLPRSLLDKLTYNRLKINCVYLGNAYEAVEGEQAMERAGRPRAWAGRPTFVAVWLKLWWFIF